MRASIIVLVAVVAACGSEGSTTPPGSGNKSVDVFKLSTAFSPNFVQIAAGDTVLFHIVPSNNGEGHDVTLDARAGAPANITVTLNGNVARVFSTRGTFH